MNILISWSTYNEFREQYVNCINISPGLRHIEEKGCSLQDLWRHHRKDTVLLILQGNKYAWNKKKITHWFYFIEIYFFKWRVDSLILLIYSTHILRFNLFKHIFKVFFGDLLIDFFTYIPISLFYTHFLYLMYIRQKMLPYLFRIIFFNNHLLNFKRLDSHQIIRQIYL